MTRINDDQIPVDNIALRKLPKNVQVLIGLIGITKAIALVEAFPGVTLSLSKGIRADGQATFAQVAEVIGDVDARRIAEDRNGEPIYIPRCLHVDALRDARNVEIRNKYDLLTRRRVSSRSAAAMLAPEYKLSDRQIFNIVNGAINEPRNLNLFA